MSKQKMIQLKLFTVKEGDQLLIQFEINGRRYGDEVHSRVEFARVTIHVAEWPEDEVNWLLTVLRNPWIPANGALWKLMRVSHKLGADSVAHSLPSVPLQPRTLTPLLDLRLWTPISEMELPVRVTNVIDRADLSEAWQLAELNEAQLRKLGKPCSRPGIGQNSLAEIKERLAELGLSTGMPITAEERKLLVTGPTTQRVLLQPVFVYAPGYRLRNVLTAAHVTYLWQLVVKTEHDVLNMPDSDRSVLEKSLPCWEGSDCGSGPSSAATA